MNGLSLVVPTHNSEKFIENTLRSYYNFFSKKFKKIEIIVVCNNCTDNTEEICASLKTELPIRLIITSKKGKGLALIKGLESSKYEILGFLDADNPFDLNKISRVISELERSDVAMVSKYLKGNLRKQEFLSRRLISLGGQIFSKTIFNMNFRDTQAGGKFFKRKVWEKIKKEKFICKGFDWDIEFLYKVRKSNFRIAEVYIPFEPEKFTTFRLKYIPGMVFRLLRLRFK